MNVFCKMCTNLFHFCLSIGITVWNPVNDLIEIIVLFDNIKAGTEINIAEIRYIGYPVIHSGNAVRGVDALIFKNPGV